MIARRTSSPVSATAWRTSSKAKRASASAASFKERRDHDVMDDDWTVSPVTQRLRDKAWTQLGTSGSGNHFVEFGAFTVTERRSSVLPPGEYLALLSHSGSRGTGAQVCDIYSKRAMARRCELAEGTQAPRVAHAR